MAGKAHRVFNFSAGPAILPEPVLERAQAEMLDWKGSGMSVMEVSHRGSDFIELAAHSEATLRDLLGISDEYHVLFLAGGATLQFASIPLNIAPEGSTVDYVITGSWGEKAASEAARYATAALERIGYPQAQQALFLPHSLRTLGRIQHAQGRFGDAAATLTAAVTLFGKDAVEPSQSADVGEALLDLAAAQRAAGDREAERTSSRALPALRAGLGAEHRLVREAERFAVAGR